MPPSGPICIQDVLHCGAVNGIVLSLGHLIPQWISVLLSHGKLLLKQNHVVFKNFQHNHRWFLPLSLSCASPISVEPMDIHETAPPPVNYLNHPSCRFNDTSYLWHQRLGHLSICNIKHLIKFNAIDGFPPLPLHDISLCHHFSVSKSKHRPFQSLSCLIVTQPGDVIVADLMGPLPISFDLKKYLYIHC
ncbi:hypothetical protein O181_008597 [Austropuccinia psidii MF-1]|uniref:GAG-pre-integrase domain-containing protein n=1 Tax=Austropuccinia psidii MF-1 TaxID=1389203 RepID=A0A9Q3GJJ1_9BASI|nr:hypothetical protein [Austropuccinia psidii MF-1]